MCCVLRQGVLAGGADSEARNDGTNAKAQRKHASAAPQIVMLHHQLSVPIEMSVFQPLCACDGGEASNALQECYVSN